MKKTYTFLAAIMVGSSVLAAEPAKQQCLLPSVSLSPSINSWISIRKVLASQLDNCLNSSDYFALYGASLLYTGDSAKSIEMLERALLINPNNGSARVDYAQALFVSGQILPAIQVNQSLLNEPDLPLSLKGALESRQSKWESFLTLWRHQISLVRGHSSNLNNATYIEDYELTFQDGTLQQSLSNESREQSGLYNYLRLNSEHYSLNEDGVSLFKVSAKSRDSYFENSDTDEFKVSYERETEGINLRNNFEVSAEYVRLGDEDLFSALEISTELHPNSTSAYLGINSRYVHFSGNSFLDEAYLSFTPGFSHRSKSFRIGVEVGIGLNKALDDRAGGDRLVYEFSTYLDKALFNGRLISSFGTTVTNDKKGYSPLLAFNEKRRTSSWAAALQYLYPLSERLTLHTSYYYRDQDSNIELFKTKNESFDMGFTYRF